MISTFFAPYKNIMLIILGVVIVSAATLSIFKFISYERDIGYKKAVAEYAARESVIEKATAAKQSQLQETIKKAQNDAITREQKINDLSVTLTDTTKRMQYTISGLRSKIAGLTADAARRQADAALDVSGECSEEYTKMATEAARLSNQLILLQDAWPK